MIREDKEKSTGNKNCICMSSGAVGRLVFPSPGGAGIIPGLEIQCCHLHCLTVSVEGHHKIEAVEHAVDIY